MGTFNRHRRCCVLSSVRANSTSSRRTPLSSTVSSAASITVTVSAPFPATESAEMENAVNAGPTVSGSVPVTSDYAS